MQKEAAPSLERLSAIHADGSRRDIQTADVHGRFVTWRRIVYGVLIAIYVSMPFVHIGGHPAMQLDIASRHFYLFGSVFNAQDGWRIVFLLLTVGTGFFFVTTWYGRIWCGWACPQTVFLEGVFRRLERWIDGTREQRTRLAAAPLSANKILRRIVKHGSYLAVSLFLANVFIAFFVSLPSLLEMVRTDPRQNWVAFLWVLSLTAIMYFNFAWFREQLCIVICPYGRLQSALLDRDSIIIGYDTKRGEPRGHVTRTERTAVALPVVQKGDCVDCGRCVVVCPTSIDIRNGSQMECVGCAQCIDACDEVMDKLSRPRGLIRYDSQNGFEGQKRRVLRPRLIIYGLLVAIAGASLVITMMSRSLFESNVIRVAGAPYVMDADSIRNQYELHLVNKNSVDTTFHVSVTAPVPMALALPTPDVHVASLDHYRIPIFVTVLRKDYKGPFEIRITVTDDASGKTKEIPTRFLGPPAGFRDPVSRRLPADAQAR